jgi:2-amino-4-hydroxy-6-hydroxymethyldihydropteridine diphosphokinase
MKSSKILNIFDGKSLNLRRWHVITLALGGNRPASRRKIEQALAFLRRKPFFRRCTVAPLYQTAPVGGPRQADFLNTAAKMETRLSPGELLRMTQAIENNLGRTRARRWGPRTVDIDILTYGREKTRDRNLILPHPRYHQRRFVLAPLRDIAPRLRHPVLKLTTASLLRKLTVSGQRVTMIAAWNGSRFQPFNKRKNPERSSPR